ncbi:MAG TPA: serine/threonine-protein kinase [Kofleriaceae bacterium]|nr:serine/threonine-protein kinase [Kofleriaceae bacterium]
MATVIEITADEPERPPPTPSRGPDPRLGVILDGRYRILAAIARGGMGVVYRGERLGLGRPVAIKFLHAEAAATPDLRRRFETEARAASRMSHPGCVAVIDYGLYDGAPYIVMDFVAGRSLASLLKEGPLAVPRALRIAEQVLAGLAHAHAHGIIHRDIKPANIMVWSDAMGEHAQLTDFGVAKIVDAPGSHSQDLAIGTPGYMSPEQTLGATVDARSDVYGAGVLLFELLTERKPFSAAKPFDVMWLHREAPVPAFDDIAPHRVIPVEIEGVVRRAMAKAPEDRYASAVELASALEAAAASAREACDDDDLDELLAEARSKPAWLKLLMFALVVGAAFATWHMWPTWS